MKIFFTTRVTGNGVSRLPLEISSSQLLIHNSGAVERAWMDFRNSAPGQTSISGDKEDLGY